MDEDSLNAVNKRIKTKVKATLNNEVKAALLDEKHRELLARLNCEYRSKSVASLNAMVHKLKPTLGKLLGTHHAIKETHCQGHGTLLCWVSIRRGSRERWRRISNFMRFGVQVIRCHLGTAITPTEMGLPARSNSRAMRSNTQRVYHILLIAQ
jgi:hypothetical protein